MIDLEWQATFEEELAIPVLPGGKDFEATVIVQQLGDLLRPRMSAKEQSLTQLFHQIAGSEEEAQKGVDALSRRRKSLVETAAPGSRESVPPRDASQWSQYRSSKPMPLDHAAAMMFPSQLLGADACGRYFACGYHGRRARSPLS